MFRISIFEIAGQSRHIKAPNRLSFKDVGHACYKIYFFESCQLSELNSFTHQESDFRRFRDSRSSVAPKKKGSRDEGSDQEVLLAARGTQYKPFRHPNHLESDVNVATGKRTEIFVLWRFHVEGMSGREAEGKSRFR
ncbi:PREDICTED: testis-expressed sequence 12 protein isoform X5 [Myotis brandtii]|uniref:testis-expressed sequence 12 protein isoform X5 n=1 Tax=Myotis brandtii TaxID=109478 RepID=UPI000703E339|nr:PREDICTED: testis-expressed sequence 12 protein isoform X5 [Myotis brandtii]